MYVENLYKSNYSCKKKLAGVWSFSFHTWEIQRSPLSCFYTILCWSKVSTVPYLVTCTSQCFWAYPSCVYMQWLKYIVIKGIWSKCVQSSNLYSTTIQELYWTGVCTQWRTGCLISYSQEVCVHTWRVSWTSDQAS